MSLWSWISFAHTSSEFLVQFQEPLLRPDKTPTMIVFFKPLRGDATCCLATASESQRCNCFDSLLTADCLVDQGWSGCRYCSEPVGCSDGLHRWSDGTMPENLLTRTAMIGCSQWISCKNRRALSKQEPFNIFQSHSHNNWIRCYCKKSSGYILWPTCNTSYVL